MCFELVEKLFNRRNTFRDIGRIKHGIDIWVVFHRTLPFLILTSGSSPAHVLNWFDKIMLNSTDVGAMAVPGADLWFVHFFAIPESIFSRLRAPAWSLRKIAKKRST